ncbi:AMP-binding protein, partial [Priestia megaterium]|uniref:AMP-binding protein n=1 Tax=Priestia megaterium TaxID=1404 RepID=UPI002FFFCE38
VSSAGKPAPHVEVKIVDPETRQEVPTGEKGEVLVRSPYLFKGYWQNEEALCIMFLIHWLKRTFCMDLSFIFIQM